MGYSLETKLKMDHIKEIESLNKKIGNQGSTIGKLKERVERLEDLKHELEQNLLAAEDQNHYLNLMKEYRDKCSVLETENQRLREKLGE